MPELPEVEIYRRYLEVTSLHQAIDLIEVEDHKLLTTDHGLLTETLVGQSFVSTKRIGKNLFVYTNGGVIMRWHFGMTGDLAYYHASLPRPRHARIVFVFRSGFNLGFICPRKFERIGLVESIEDFLKQKRIASDALDIDLETFHQHLRRRKAPIKSVLLDQSTVAGIGNWIVDDVLFQAKVHPEKLSSDLTDQAIADIHFAMREVVEVAIRHEVNYNLFPKSFLIHARGWSISPYDDPKQHLNCPNCNQPIAQIRVAGRTTYYCKTCQH